MNSAKAVRINLLDVRTFPMRNFHLSWAAFFLSFFAWFAVAPLMPLVRQDLGLTQEQIGNCIIASVSITIVVRLLMGWLCDRMGPRLAYSGLLILGSLPVMGIGLAHDYHSFLLFRLAIGAIGASFVITQYHTSLNFAPNCVGTANATSAGWGNLGGGVTQMVMPLVLSLILSLGIDKALGWRLSMLLPGLALLIMGFVYYRWSKDFPDGTNIDVRGRNNASGSKGSFRATVKDFRVLALSLMYAASFGVELTMNNILALYFTDQFHLTLAMAGMVASCYGLMDIFARACGGILSDRAAAVNGLKARVMFLGWMLLAAGLALIIFSRMTVLPAAIGAMAFAALCVKISNGAVYGLVPFMNKRATGAVAGIVGAGGNVGGMLFGLLFRQQGISYATGIFYLGCLVAAAAGMVFFIRFSTQLEQETAKAFNEAKSLKLQTA